MRNLKTITIAIIFVMFASYGIARAAPSWIYQTTILPISNNAYDLGTTTDKWRNIYTQDLTISGTCTGCSSGSGTVSTSSVPTIGNLAYWTSNGYPSLLGSVATSTLTASSPLTGSFIQIGSGGSLGLGTVGVANGGTNLTSYTLGDIIYASAANTLSTLAGNTLTTPLYLSMTGDGVNAAAPSWQAIPIAGSKAYYAYATQATSSVYYFNMNPTATTTSTTVAYPLTATTQTVQNWISPVGDPNVSVIPGGAYIVDLFAWRSSGTAAITLKVQVWEVSSTGADIAQIGETNSTPSIAASKTQYNLTFTTGTYTMTNTSSRLLMRVVATTAGTPTLSLAMGASDQMDLTTPGATVSVSNFVPYTGATANVNLGAFNASTTQFTASGLSWLTGFLSSASSTIGNNLQKGGLTINGGATTTGFIVEQGAGTSTFVGGISTAKTLDVQSSTATSTFANGIELTGGCILINGSCVGGTGTVTSVGLGTPNSSLTISGTNPVTTSGTINADLNLNHTNWWTALQNFTNASTSQFTATSSVYFATDRTAARSVNIGTTTPNIPGAILNIQGNNGYPTSILLDSEATLGTFINFQNLGASKGYFGYSATGLGGFAFYESTGNTINMLITDGGRIGIGTTSPYAQFSVFATPATVNANKTIFAIGSSTAAFATSTFVSVLNNGNVGIGTSSPGTFFSIQGVLNALTSGLITFLGEIVGYDMTNGWNGRISPTHGMIFSIATSTATWTATSTPGVDSSPNFVAPFAGTIKQVRCGFNTFLGVNITINGTAITPSYFVASSTVGKIAITGNNTFNAGDKIVLNAGTTTTAVVASGVVNGSCTADVTETP